MDIETTRTERGVTFTVRGAQRQTLRYRHFLATLGVDVKDTSEIARTQFDFCYVAGHLTAITGVDWQPPDMDASRKVLAQSFETYLDALSQPVTTRAILNAIAYLYGPQSDAVERPEETLTGEQAADPN